MSRIKATKSSAALIVAVVALVAALGGGAVAGVTVSKLNNKEKQQVKKISKKQANKRINKKAPNLSVASADFATVAQTADTAANAESATNATNAQSATTANSANALNGVSLAQGRSGTPNSESGKIATATCPTGQRVLGTGADIEGGKSGLFPNRVSNVVIDEIKVIDDRTAVQVLAFEIGTYTGDWSVVAKAICGPS